MTRRQFRAIMNRDGFDAAMSKLAYEKNDLTDYDTLKQYVIKKIEEDSNMLALHIWNAVYNTDDGDSRWYRYDYTAGTCDTPTYLQTIDDVADANFFD